MLFFISAKECSTNKFEITHDLLFFSFLSRHYPLATTKRYGEKQYAVPNRDNPLTLILHIR